MRALSTSTGALRWRFATGGSIRARPTVSGDVVLVHSDDGSLYALSLEDGSERWRMRLGPPSARRPLGDPGSRYEHFASSPAVAADGIYVANAAGEIYGMAGGTPEQAALSVAVSSALHTQLGDGPCRAYGSDLRVRVVAT